MKEIIVKRDFFGHYSKIGLTTAYTLITELSYDYVGFQSDDRTISIVFPTLGFKVDDEKRKEELMKYFKYVEEITGIEAPEEIEIES